MYIAALAEQKHRNADNTLCKKLQHKNSKGNKNVIFKWKKVDDAAPAVVSLVFFRAVYIVW